jgi:hypothetical protein
MGHALCTKNTYRQSDPKDRSAGMPDDDRRHCVKRQVLGYLNVDSPLKLPLFATVLIVFPKSTCASQTGFGMVIIRRSQHSSVLL